MENENVDMDLRQNFLSANKKVARDSFGVFYKVGETVTRDSDKNETAIIEYFEFDERTSEVKAITDKGYAHLDFLAKI